MLPRADGQRPAQHEGVVRRPRADDVGDDPVECEVAAADHVAGPGGDHAVRQVGPGVGDELGGRLARGVGVLAAEEVALAERRRLAHVVDLVGGHDERGLHVGQRLDQRQHPHGAHDVGPEGAGRVAVALADEGLRGEVEHDLGPERGGARQPSGAGDVVAHVPDALELPAGPTAACRPRSGGSETAYTSAPRSRSQQVSQDPLKPV